MASPRNTSTITATTTYSLPMLRRKSAGGSEADCAQSCATVLAKRKRVSARRVIARRVWLGRKGSSAVGANVRFATTLFREITGILRWVADQGIFLAVSHQIGRATARRSKEKLEEQEWADKVPAQQRFTRRDAEWRRDAEAGGTGRCATFNQRFTRISARILVATRLYFSERAGGEEELKEVAARRLPHLAAYKTTRLQDYIHHSSSSHPGSSKGFSL